MGDRLAVLAALAGVGVAIVAAIVLSPSPPTVPRLPSPSGDGVAGAPVVGPSEPGAVAAFLDAWERSRLATYVVDSTFTRTLADGRQLTSTTRIVQRPPDDRLVSGTDGVSGRVGGATVRCGTADGVSRCFPGVPAAPYGEQVDRQVERFRTFLDGPSALYQVRVGGPGCFVLRLRVAYPSAPYGDDAEFCFDAATGAPVRTVVRRPEGVDETVATTVRATVTDADLALPGS